MIATNIQMYVCKIMIFNHLSGIGLLSLIYLLGLHNL